MLCCLLDIRRYIIYSKLDFSFLIDPPLIIYSDISVTDPGEAPPPPPPSIFLDQNEARRAEKKIWGDRAPPSLWQTANVRFKIENVQLKTVQNNCYYFGVEVINSKEVQVKRKHGHVVQIHLPFSVNVTLSLSLHCLPLVIDSEHLHSQ